MAKGVQLVESAAEAEKAAASLLGKTLVTYQTGAAGQADLQGARHGRPRHRPRALPGPGDRPQPPVPGADGHDRGGRRDRDRRPRDAREDPSRADRRGPGPGRFPGPQGLQGARALTGDTAKKGAIFFKNFVKLFIDKDASLAEINPLIVTESGDVLALDCKLNFDDNALFRHPDIAAMLDETEEDPAELRAAQSGLSYVSLDGDIACLVNGAGLAMSTMDLIKYHGGEPANFLDVGGGANKDQVLEGFRILLVRRRGSRPCW